MAIEQLGTLLALANVVSFLLYDLLPLHQLKIILLKRQVKFEIGNCRNAARQTPHPTATHSISISNSIGHDATGTKLRAGGLTLKYFA